MALTSREINKILDAINVGFAKLGKTNSSAMPKSSKNNEGIAWELFVAYHLDRLAGKRKKISLSEAVSAGLLPDPEIYPQPLGVRIPYKGDNISLSQKVTERKGATHASAFYNALAERGVAEDILNECWDEATSPPGKSYTYDGVPIVED